MLSSAAFEANHRGAIRSTLATLLLVLLFAATMQAQGEDDIDCRSLVNEDRRAICDHDRKQKEREREWDAALAEVNQAIALKGDDTNFYLRRAELYDKKGNTEQAIADLTRAAELSPDDYRSYFNRVFLYERTGQFDPAVADYNKLITLFPHDAYYKTRRAAVLSKAAAPLTVAPAAKPRPERVAEPSPSDEQVSNSEVPGKADCRWFDALSNKTIAVTCPD